MTSLDEQAARERQITQGQELLDERRRKGNSKVSATEDVDATVRRLAGLSPIEYDRQREAEADALGVRVTTLDAEVAKMRPRRWR